MANVADPVICCHVEMERDVRSDCYVCSKCKKRVDKFTLDEKRAIERRVKEAMFIAGILTEKDNAR